MLMSVAQSARCSEITIIMMVIIRLTANKYVLPADGAHVAHKLLTIVQNLYSIYANR